MAAGRVAWDLIVQDWLFPPGRPTERPAARPGAPERHLGSMVHLPDAAKSSLDAMPAFEAAAAAVTGGALPDLTTDAQLELYGLFKQVRQGDCPADAAPSALDLTGSAKHQSWAKQRGKDQQTCARLYVLRVLELAGAVRSSQANEGTSNTVQGVWPIVTASHPDDDDEDADDDDDDGEAAAGRHRGTVSVVTPAGHGEAGVVATYEAAWRIGLLRARVTSSQDEAVRFAAQEPSVAASTSSSTGADAAAARGMTTPPSSLQHLEASPALPSHGSLSDAESRMEEAVRNGDVAAVRALLKDAATGGAALATAVLDSDGTTVLHSAAEAGSTEVMSLLLASGADARRATADGLTPLHFACGSADAAMCALLLRHGASFDDGPEGGKPLDALHEDDVEVAEGETAAQAFRDAVEAML